MGVSSLFRRLFLPHADLALASQQAEEMALALEVRGRDFNRAMKDIRSISIALVHDEDELSVFTVLLSDSREQASPKAELTLTLTHEMCD